MRASVSMEKRVACHELGDALMHQSCKRGEKTARQSTSVISEMVPKIPGVMAVEPSVRIAFNAPFLVQQLTQAICLYSKLSQTSERICIQVRLTNLSDDRIAWQSKCTRPQRITLLHCTHGFLEPSALFLSHLKALMQEYCFQTTQSCST